MNPLAPIKKFFKDAADAERGRKLDALLARPIANSGAFVYDGTASNPIASTYHQPREQAVIGGEKITVRPILLTRRAGKAPRHGDRVVLKDDDGVRRLYVMYDEQELTRKFYLTPSLVAVPLEKTPYAGGFGTAGQYETDYGWPLKKFSPAGVTP